MKKHLAVLILLLICAAFVPAQSGPFTPAAAVTLNITPSSPTMGEDITVEVYVNLTGVANSGSTAAALGGFCVPVAFDNTRMQLKTVVKGAASQFTGNITYTDLPRANARGFVTVVNAQTSAGVPTGNVHVATLTFGLTEAGSMLFNVNSARTDHEGSLASTYDPGHGGGPALIAYNDQNTTLNVGAGTNNYHLIFPAFMSKSTDFQGVTLVNESATAAAMTFRAYDPTGALITAAGMVNPNTLATPLPSNNQYVRMAENLFGASAALNIEQGWIDVESPVHNISGFFLLGHLAGAAVTQMDGVDVSHLSSSRLIFPLLWKEATRDTKVTVVNPSATPAAGTLEVVNADASVFSTTPINIPAHGMYEATFPANTLAGDGYFDVTLSSGAATGLETFGNTNAMAVLAAMDGNLMSNILFAPQIETGLLGIRWFTDVNVVNPGTEAANVTFRLYNNTGAEQVTAATRTIQPGAQLRIMTHTLFGLPDPLTATNAVTGYLKVESDKGLVGNVTFGDAQNGTILSSLPLMSTASAKRQTYFDHVALGTINNVTYYTGIAMVNPSKDRTAHVTVTLYNATTFAQVGQATVDIAPGNRYINMVSAIDPTFNVTQFGGFVKITSDVEVYSFMLFGDVSSVFMSAVPVR